MPELPDVTVYRERIEALAGGQRLEALRLESPFLLRTVEPAPEALVGRRLDAVRRIGKRIVLAFEGAHFAVVHLMIAGRFRWRPPGARPPGRISLAVFQWPSGQLVLTEAGSQRRASLHLVAGEDALAAFDRGGLDVRSAGLEAFRAALVRESHTLKRTLTDPTILDGIGNAYSDEILHRARLSPVKMSTKLDDDETGRLHAACRAVLDEWTERLRAEAGDGLPEKVTAFHEGMAVHGRYGKPCPVCATAVQRIRYASNETNYCPRCQTEGRLLADRSLSRLLKKDWPRRIEELEDRR
jgi:formamidopyrimidine-DNA glycosylase